MKTISRLGTLSKNLSELAIFCQRKVLTRKSKLIKHKHICQILAHYLQPFDRSTYNNSIYFFWFNVFLSPIQFLLFEMQIFWHGNELFEYWRIFKSNIPKNALYIFEPQARELKIYSVSRFWNANILTPKPSSWVFAGI